jgi:hypothetical protein
MAPVGEPELVDSAEVPVQGLEPAVPEAPVGEPELADSAEVPAQGLEPVEAAVLGASGPVEPAASAGQATERALVAPCRRPAAWFERSSRQCRRRRRFRCVPRQHSAQPRARPLRDRSRLP